MILRLIAIGADGIDNDLFAALALKSAMPLVDDMFLGNFYLSTTRAG
jgi:hypothetical protein